MSDFLYPFIESDEREVGALLTDLADSARGKVRLSAALRDETLRRVGGAIDTVATRMSERFAAGGRMLVFGNGGSSTDAASMARLFATPPWGQPLPARALVDDSAVLTAIGNDVGYELVFARQVIAHGREGDIAVGLSTSGNSRNVLGALGEADRRGMLTIGIAGYSGGELAGDDRVHHCLVVEADSVHRIQETQAAVVFAVWQAVQAMSTSVGSPA